MYVGKIDSIRFTPYFGSRFPEGNPNYPKLLPEGEQYYALPGGGVGKESDIRKWAGVYGCSVKFIQRHEIAQHD